MLGTIETQYFELYSSIFHCLLCELLDVNFGTAAVFTVGATRDISIPVLLEFRQPGRYSDKACFVKLLGGWPKASPAELGEVISNFGEMIASTIFYISIMVLHGNALVLEQRSHDILEIYVELIQNSFAIVFNTVLTPLR